MNRDQLIASILKASSPKPIRLEVDDIGPVFVRVMTAYDADRLRRQLDLSKIRIKSVSATNPAMIKTFKKHGLQTGDIIDTKGVHGVEGSYVVINETETTFELFDLDGTDLPEYKGGGFIGDALEVGRLIAGILADEEGKQLFETSDNDAALNLSKLSPNAQSAILNASNQANSADPKP